MVLSNADWLAKRPDRLKGLEAGRVMEAIRTNRFDTLEDWQAGLEDCERLLDLLDRAPRKLGRALTPSFKAALAGWRDETEKRVKEGRRAMPALCAAYLDEVCTLEARRIDQAGRDLIHAARLRMKEEKRLDTPARDRAAHGRFVAELEAMREVSRLARRQRMEPHLRTDPRALDLIRRRVVRLSSYRMACERLLKNLEKSLADARAAYDRLMADAPPPRRRRRIVGT